MKLHGHEPVYLRFAVQDGLELDWGADRAWRQEWEWDWGWDWAGDRAWEWDNDPYWVRLPQEAGDA